MSGTRALARNPKVEERVIRNAYEAVKDEENWTQRVSVDASGRMCAVGALNFCVANDGVYEEHIEGAHLRLEAIAREMFGLTLVEVNDHVGHAAVMQVFEKAIVGFEGGL